MRKTAVLKMRGRRNFMLFSHQAVPDNQCVVCSENVALTSPLFIYCFLKMLPFTFTYFYFFNLYLKCWSSVF